MDRTNKNLSFTDLCFLCIFCHALLIVYSCACMLTCPEAVLLFHWVWGWIPTMLLFSMCPTPPREGLGLVSGPNFQ